MFEYRAFGLHVRSAVALPFGPPLPPLEPASEPDVDVRLDAVPETLPAGTGGTVQGPIWQACPGAFLIEIEGVARYLATDGKEVLIEPHGGDADVAATFFLSAAFIPILQQRGVMTLHAAAVEYRSGAVLLLGHTAAGKSSLAAALAGRRRALLADDVTGVVLDGRGRPIALPAFARQRLWAHTLDKMNLRGRTGAKVRRDLEKYWFEAERYCAEPRPVLAAFALTVHNSPDIRTEPLSCGDAFWLLSESTPRRRALNAMSRTATHFRVVTELARRVPMLRAKRPRHPFLLEELADRVDAHLRALQPSVPKRRTAAAAAPAAGRPNAATPAITWLASYPKSGSTWLRAVLTNYLSEGGGPASINALLGGLADDRQAFDEFLGLESSDMTEAEVERHLPQFREWLVESRWAAPPFFDPPVRGDAPLIVKTHESCRTAHGAMRFSPVGAAAVYLVRNPLDVAVSFAHHSSISIDRTIAWMGSEGSSGSPVPGGVGGRLQELLGTWSGHVSSWTEEADLPVHIARYEDLIADPHAGFGAIVRFIGLGESPARLHQAVEQAGFERLRAQEAEFGFVEKPPKARSFFRAGAAGSWRTALAPRQVRALVGVHGEVMARFGYLREAQSFLGE